MGQQHGAVKAMETRTGAISGAGAVVLPRGRQGLRVGHTGGHCRTIRAGCPMWGSLQAGEHHQVSFTPLGWEVWTFPSVHLW